MEIVLFIVGPLVGIAATAGVIFAVFRTNVVTRTISDYKDENDILARSVARQEKEIIELHHKLELIQTSNQMLQDTYATAATVAEMRLVLNDLGNMIRRLEVNGDPAR